MMAYEYANYAVIIWVLATCVCVAYVDIGLGHINVANMIQPGTWSPDGREDPDVYYRRIALRYAQ